MRRRTRVLLIAAAAGIIGLHLAFPGPVVGHGTCLALGFGAAGVTWYAVRRSTGRTRRFAQKLAVGVTASALANVVVLASPLLRSLAPGHLLWLTSYLAMAAALFTMLNNTSTAAGFDAEALIDAAVVFVLALLVLWPLRMEPMLDVGGPLLATSVLTVLHPMLGMVVLSLVLRLLLRGTTRAGLLLAGGSGCWLVADLYLLIAPDSASRQVLDTFWMVGVVVITASTLASHAVFEKRAPAPDEPAVRVGRTRAAVTLLPMLVPGLLELRGFIAGEDPNPIPILVGTALLVLLAYLRSARLVTVARTWSDTIYRSKRYATALAANSADAVVVMDRTGRMINDGGRLADLLGLPGGNLCGIELIDLMDPIDQAEPAAVVERCLLAPGVTLQTELRLRHRDGHSFWLRARLLNLLDDPDIGGILVNLHDVTDRKQAEDELVHQAFHDSLTGLANRALFRDRLEHAIRRGLRDGADSAVVFLDLDGFKNVNDSLGHDAGDDLLREAAARLVGAVRPGDTVGRLGGDEFAILVEHSHRPLDEVTAIADRVLQTLSEPVRLGEHEIVLTASLGIAVCAGYTDSGHLLRDADVAMYRAKTMGKGRWVVFEPGMRAAAVERLELESDLRSALAEGRFFLVYQPVIELESERVVGFEALLRWRRPGHGVIAPDRFIPILEENGQIVPIGRWVLGEATRTAARWQRRVGTGRSLTMAVNVSARQLADPGLVDDVATALARSGLEPSCLVLEMTETVLVEDAETAAQRLGALRELGIRLAIDDFGTGYSSLSYLRQFPVDILKIDRSFINSITRRDQVPAIVRGLLDLGRTLELETVAEGVEHDFQRNRLRDENCTLAQGYLFAQPLEAGAAEELLDDLSLGTVA
jgi:diguanylate cyclase (GGDEF)-like protein/PAS domain S-box-containing protein